MQDHIVVISASKALFTPLFSLNPTCTTLLYKLRLFNYQILYKLQLVQPVLYKLQLVQSGRTSCNLYRRVVQVATCTKSQLVHNVMYMKAPDVNIQQ